MSIPPSQSNSLGYVKLQDKELDTLNYADNKEGESLEQSETTTTAQTPASPPPTKQEDVVEQNTHEKDEIINDTSVSLLEQKLEKVKASSPENVAYQSDESSANEEDNSADDYVLLEQNLKFLQRRRIETKQEFFEESFKVFKKIHDATYKKQTNKKRQSVFVEDELPDIDTVFEQYMDLASSFEDTKKTEPIWELAQRLYFSTPSIATPSRIGKQLKAWYDLHYPADEIDDWEDQEAPTMYVYARKYLLRGDLHQAVDLLQHTLTFIDEEKHTYLKKLISLIQQYETGLEEMDEHNLAEYDTFWSSWHQTAQLHYRNYKSGFDNDDTTTDDIDEHLLSLYGILAGVELHLREWSQQSGRDWLDSIIGTILFAKSQMSVQELNSMARDIGSFGDGSHLTADENNLWPIYGHLIMGTFDDALSAMGDDAWLQTHLGHALLVSGAYYTATQPNDTAEEGLEKPSRLVDPVYYCINMHANMIAEEFDMWNEAVTYLSSCSVNKEVWIKQLLGTPPLPNKDSTFLESILETVDHYQLKNAKAYINQELGRRCEQSNNIREATIRYALASNTPSLDRLAQQNMEDYLEKGTLQNVVTEEEYRGVKLDLTTKSSYYKVLLDYHRFKNELAEKQWSEAAKSSVSLIWNKYLPRLFQTVLLVDVMDILEDRQYHYTAKQMRSFIDLFNEVTRDSASEAFVTEYYQRVRSTGASAATILAKIRERISYKAATAPEKLA